jgi:hypothetical protein
MTTPDPLLERLRRLPRPSLDDVAAARTLARAEAAFASGHASAGVGPTRARLSRAWVPAALALWGGLYAWGAVRELTRLYPASPAQPAVVRHHRGPDGADARSQFMLNAISRARPSTTPTMTSTVLRPDALPVCVDVSSDMESSMQVVACDTRNATYVVRGGPRHDRGAAGGAIGARAASAARSCTVGTNVATRRSVSVWGGNFQKLGRGPDSRAARSCSGSCWGEAIGVRSPSPPSVAARAAAATAAAGSTGVPAAANAPKNDSTAMEIRARKTRSL